MRRLNDVVREWARAVMQDELPGMAAELAYWFFLSLFPFFVFLTALGSIVAAIFDVQDPTGRIIDVLSAYMPPEATKGSSRNNFPRTHRDIRWERRPKTGR